MSTAARRTRTVAQQVFTLQVVTVLVVLAIGVTLAVVDARSAQTGEARTQVVSVARAVADSPAVLSALKDPDPSARIQPYAEAVRVVFDPSQVTYEQLLREFWEDHDPTQGFRQGNDVGTQYRSAIYTHGPEQLATALASRDMFAAELAKAGFGEVTTEIREAPEFYFAEEYHQQYLAKNPNGYCPNHRTGVALPDLKVTPLQYVE